MSERLDIVPAQLRVIVVRMTQGAVRAKDVVFAGGAYTRGVLPRIERAMLPIAIYVIATEPLGARPAEAIDPSHAVYDTRFVSAYNFARSKTLKGLTP
nr:hypothetical protein [Mesorhizobium sp. WSM3626]